MYGEVHGPLFTCSLNKSWHNSISVNFTLLWKLVKMAKIKFEPPLQNAKRTWSFEKSPHMAPKWKLSGRQITLNPTGFIHVIHVNPALLFNDNNWILMRGQTRGNQMALLSTSLSTFTYRFDMLAKINWRRCWLQNHIYTISFPKYQKRYSNWRISQFMLLWTPTLHVKWFRRNTVYVT